MFKTRRVLQFVVLGLVFVLTLRHMNLGIEKAAPIDAYCPFGAIEGMLTYITTGEFLKRIFLSSFILMGIVFLMTLLFGRVFCSHLCPLGALQEWVRMLGRKIGIKKDLELPKKVDAIARYFKYVILIAIIYFSYQVGDLVFRAYDPFNALMHLGEEFEEKVVGYSILGVLLLGSLFTKNWWCRYFCPLGATLGIIRKLSPFKLTRDKNTCIGCGACDRVCPAGLGIEKANEIKSADCISCLDCVKDCPKSSLKASVLGIEFSKKTFGVIVAVAFFVPLAIIVATPFWQTKATSNIVKNTGELDVANLRGSNTLQFLLDTTKIPFSVFQEKLNLPQDMDKTMKLKDIGPKYDLKKSDGAFIETEDFRAVVEEKMGTMLK